MAKMFGDREIALWADDLETFQPEAWDDAWLGELTEVRSVRADPMTAGAVLQIALADGRVSAFTVNPLAAHALIRRLLKAGRDGGWLDEDGNGVIPDRPRDH